MPKTVRTAEQIRDELQNRVEKIAADVPGALRVRIPLPERHPPDASGRNWNMAPRNDLGADYAHHIQKVIEDMRTEFVLPD
ncbi:hypothetical protein F4827_004775 [Paraburkholderia bannensis]|uniref:Uncharacterized protein n=1 Tax=Paraburkholderia bannensis TaxID=765414 RepID=A0A7W9WT31_9BURK|nr:MULTISPECIES: hypothetical protein [Paraburkholderia]MBB3259779.1 hypothetical protein [Paraburkholderia sp. WP4_3_2]MBB6104910.1 hypothetical protein [Paraburkholderia bannensis]